MAIPTMQEVMLPLLKCISDGRTYTQQDRVRLISEIFNLSDEEKNEKTKSGDQRRIYSNVHWAKIHMQKAGLIELIPIGKLKITQRGIDLVNKNLKSINREILMKYEEYRDFRAKSHSNKNHKIDSSNDNDEKSSDTPDEVMESSYTTINEALASELLDTIKSCSPDFFERLVVDLMLKMGYGGPQKAGRAIGRSGDGGVDGVINEDKLGLDVIYLQAKRYQNPVPVREVRDFAGSLLGKRSSKGIFITTSKFSNDTFDFIKNIDRKIILIDGQQLAQYMIEYNVGVSTYKTYEIKKIDSDYFEDI